MSRRGGRGREEGRGGAAKPAVDATTADALHAGIRTNRRAWIRFGIFGLVTAGIFVLLSTRIDYGEVVRTLRAADRGLLLIAASFTIAFPILSAARWRRMLLALGYDVPFRDCLNMIMAAWPMGTITPSKSGDLIKAYYLKNRVPVSLVLGSVLTERVMDVLVLLGLALFGSLLFGRWELAAVAGVGLGAGLLLIFLLLRMKLPVPAKFQGKVEPMLRSLRLLRSPALLLTVIALTVANWFASIFQMVFAYMALGAHVPLLFAAGALPLAIFVGLLPITLSGMGTRDSAIILLFAPYAAAGVSLGVSIIYSLLGYWLPSLIGLPFLHWALPRDTDRPAGGARGAGSRDGSLPEGSSAHADSSTRADATAHADSSAPSDPSDARATLEG